MPNTINSSIQPTYNFETNETSQQEIESHFSIKHELLDSPKPSSQFDTYAGISSHEAFLDEARSEEALSPQAKEIHVVKEGETLTSIIADYLKGQGRDVLGDELQALAESTDMMLYDIEEWADIHGQESAQVCEDVKVEFPNYEGDCSEIKFSLLQPGDQLEISFDEETGKIDINFSLDSHSRVAVRLIRYIMNEISETNSEDISLKLIEIKKKNIKFNMSLFINSKENQTRENVSESILRERFDIQSHEDRHKMKNFNEKKYNEFEM